MCIVQQYAQLGLNPSLALTLVRWLGPIYAQFHCPLYCFCMGFMIGHLNIVVAELFTQLPSSPWVHFPPPTCSAICAPDTTTGKTILYAWVTQISMLCFFATNFPFPLDENLRFSNWSHIYYIIKSQIDVYTPASVYFSCSTQGIKVFMHVCKCLIIIFLSSIWNVIILFLFSMFLSIFYILE